MQIRSKSQSSLEYLIVMGVAIFILVTAISYSIYYQVGYNSASTSQDLQLAATSISNAVTAVSGGEIGSSQQFSFSSPGLSLTSSICNTSLSLNFAGEQASQSLSMYTTGELPVNSGTYQGNVKLVKENGQSQAQLTMDLPISYISTSYTYNPSSIFYNVSFLDTSGNLVGDVNFTVIIYNNNKIVAEQNETTISGYYSGSIIPTNGQFSSNSIAEIYVEDLGIISPSCFLPQKLLFVPGNVLNFLPLEISNNQNLSTSNPFQQELTINSANYQQYEASNLQNVEFFFPNGTIINSWLESGNSNTDTSTVYWLKIAGIPAHSSETIYMGFASKSSNIFNTTNDGEAPQLSSTYAQYDNGANVFLDYFSGDSSAGWTTAGTSGQTTSAPSGSPFGTNALYALDSGGNYMYTHATGQSTNMVIEYYTYINNLNDVFFLVNSAGTGQLARQGSGGGWYGIASTSSWTAWNAPPDTGVWSGEWVLSAVVVSGGIAQQYLSTTLGNYGSEIGQNPSNSYTVANNGNYLGLIGDSASSSDEYWNGIIVRAYPPNGVMPSVTVGSVQPQITVFVNGVKDGNNGIAQSTSMNITAFGVHASHIGLIINGSVVVPLGSASLSYQKSMPAGLYNITVFSNQSRLANQTYWEAVANIPNGVTNFVPISITNQQSLATSSPFQQNISIDSFAYKKFENQSLTNVEFFTPIGTVIPSWLESGDMAKFNGNSYANLPENFPFGAAGSFTISVWFKTTSDGVVLWNGNTEQASTAGTYSPIIYVNTNGDLAGGDWVGNQPFNTNDFVANGQWNFVTITQTSSEQILYLNGNEIASHSSSSVQAVNPVYWTIGEGYAGGWSNTNNSNFYFNGYISNIQFYNQVFSSSKVALLYDEGIAGSPLNSSGLIAWYLLSGNGNQQNGNNNLLLTNVQFKGVSSVSTSTNYWLKLGTINPQQSYIAFMGFVPPNRNLFNTTNDGEAPKLSPIYGEYNDIGNVMDSGLIYQIYFDNSGSCNSQSYQTQLYNANLGDGTTVSGCASMVSSTSPFTTLLSGTTQSVNGNNQNNVIINYQSGYSGGSPYPNPPVSNVGNSWDIKAIGWAELSSSTTFSEFSDDGITLSYANLSVSDSNGQNWLGSTSSPNNLISGWVPQGGTQYNSAAVPEGVYRLEMDYFEYGGGSYTALWSNNPVNYYHAAYPPNGVMPLEIVGPFNGKVS
jgi:hypothetical protein